MRKSNLDESVKVEGVTLSLVHPELVEGKG
jgi:hypothetical protein